MNIVTIIGSPHGMKGNTGRLLSSVEASLKGSGADVTQFDVARMDVKPCRGCGSCHKTGQCVIKDDFKEVEAALLKADGIVLASPNYIFSVTAQMKAAHEELRESFGAAVEPHRTEPTLPATTGGDVVTAVDGARLRTLNEELLRLPDWFTPPAGAGDCRHCTSDAKNKDCPGFWDGEKVNNASGVSSGQRSVGGRDLRPGGQ